MQGGTRQSIDEEDTGAAGADAAHSSAVQRISKKGSRSSSSSTSTRSNYWNDLITSSSNLLAIGGGKLKQPPAAPTTSDEPAPYPIITHSSSRAWISKVKELTSENEALKQSLLHSRSEKEELRRKLDDAEMRNAKQSSYSDGSGGGSYDESGPSPPQLQKAVKSVVFGLGQCSAAIFRFIRSSTSLHKSRGIVRVSDFCLPCLNLDQFLSSTPPIDTHIDDPTSTSHHALTSSPVASKLALAAFLCSVFFSPSENGCWSFPSRPIFRRPDQLRQELFQIYRLCKSEDILLKLLINDLWDDIVQKICALPAGAPPQPPPSDRYLSIIPDALKPSLQDLLHFLFCALQSKQLRGFAYCGHLLMSSHCLLGNKDFKTSFVRLAWSAWLLHKLAFSFKPTVEIIVVPPGSPFDSDFMEDTTPIEDEVKDDRELEDTYHDNDDNDNVRGSGDPARAGDAEDGGGRRVVALMSVPGFAVRGNVIKSQVICGTPFVASFA